MGLFTTHTYRELAVPYEKTVHEHRAPTDESIKILREMEEKSRQQIVEKFVVNNNVVNGSVTLFRDAMTDNHECRVRLVLNGDEHTETFVVPGAVYKAGKYEAVEYLAKTMSQAVFQYVWQRLLKAKP